MENETNITPETEPSFELSPEQATGFGGTGERPGKLNRKRTLIIIIIIFSVVIGGGLLFNVSQSSKPSSRSDSDVTAADSPDSLLRSLRDRAAANRVADLQKAEPPPEPDGSEEPLLPEVLISRPERTPAPPPPPAAPPPPPPAQYPAAQAQGPDMSPIYQARLVPQLDGALFAGGAARPPSQTPAAQTQGNPNPLAARNAAGTQNPGQNSEYAAQNDQQGKQAFFDPDSGGGEVFGGFFHAENALWIGTMIPGILETAINTDLPGNVLARVTRNMYDSRTGRKLLIPQGTILIAKYNSSVSYAQHRAQIVWDTMIRPDGYQVDFGGMNSVDREGMSGQEAQYHENWFEYLKAAGIVTMFSLANARMADAAARYADASAAAVAGSGSEVVNQLGGNMVGRAMNIQPTLTVDNGTMINIMLNKTLYLPPVDGVATFRR